MTLWMIYSAVVHAPPYPGYMGCFIIYVAHNLVPLWVLWIVWDGGKRKFVI